MEKLTMVQIIQDFFKKTQGEKETETHSEQPQVPCDSDM